MLPLSPVDPQPQLLAGGHLASGMLCALRAWLHHTKRPSMAADGARWSAYGRSYRVSTQ